MTHSLDALTDKLLTAARKAGADAADALALDGTSISIDVRAGGLEHAERAEGLEPLEAPVAAVLKNATVHWAE